MKRFDWNNAADAELSRLWHEGLSTAAIARRMDPALTKNAIVGRAHRLKLPARPSPISSTPRSEAAAVRRAQQIEDARRMHCEGYSTRQIAARLGVRFDKAAKLLSSIGLTNAERKPLPAAKPVAPVVVAKPVAPVVVPAEPAVRFLPPAARCCRWPMWNNRERPTHVYCDKPTVTRADGVPDVYCARHRAKATAQTSVRAA